MSAVPTYANSFKMGHNRFGTARHVLAMAVLLDHAFVLTGQHGALPVTLWRTSLGSLAVACFFMLSGALVTASWLERPSASIFFRARALRLLPGYFTCLILTASVIAPLAWLQEHGELRGYWSATPGPIGYLLRNSMLMQWQPSIPGLFSDHIELGAINGSLWSIPWEAACYGLVVLLGITGALVHFELLLPLLTLALLANALIFPPGSLAGLLYLSERIALLPMYFLSGATFFLYRQHIPRLATAGWLSSAALVIGGCFNWPLTAVLFLPYAFFYFATSGTCAVQPAPKHRPDLSYGIYIYGFPLQQLLIAIGIGNPASPVAPFVLLVASILLVLPLSWLSWTFVEAPALRLKASGTDLRLKNVANQAVSPR